MVERQVDDAIALIGTGDQAIELAKFAAVRHSTHRFYRSRGFITARESEDVVTRLNELPDGGFADETGPAGNENAHIGVLLEKGLSIPPALDAPEVTAMGHELHGFRSASVLTVAPPAIV